MRPPSSSRPPKASVYAVIIHCRSASLMCSACWAVGRAMLTIVASSTISSWETAMIPSASHFRDPDSGDMSGGTAAASVVVMDTVVPLQGTRRSTQVRDVGVGTGGSGGLGPGLLVEQRQHDVVDQVFDEGVVERPAMGETAHEE